MSEIPTTETTPTSTPPEITPTPTPEPSLITEPAAKPEDGKTLATEAPFDPETLPLPEGFEKGEYFDQFVEWAKDAGINQTRAEKLINLYTESAKKQTEAFIRALEDQNANWQKEVKEDKELGGTNLTGVKQTISKLLDNPDLSDPKFREALDFTGAGNHPAVIRTLYRWAQKLSEGASIAGSPPGRDGNGQIANAPRSPAEALYGPSGPHSGGPRLG